MRLAKEGEGGERKGSELSIMQNNVGTINLNNTQESSNGIRTPLM